MVVWWIIGIFIVDLIAAYTWTECVQAVEKKKVLASGLWAGGMYLASFATILSYNEHWWLAIPAILGCILGTSLSVKLRKDEN